MPAFFKPDTTVRQLLEGRRKPGEIVRVAGRASRQAESPFVLVDGEARVTVAMAAGEENQPTEAAWIGVEGWWSQEGHLQDARVVFLQRPRLNVADATTGNLPETAFLTDADRLVAIRMRSQLVTWARSFLEDRGFLAVQTPMLRAAPEVAYLQQLETRSINGGRLYVRTDPEEYLKRYLTIGLEAVYEISTNVRGEWPDGDRLQEFTSVECYRRFWTFTEALLTSSDLVTGALKTLRGGTVTELHGQPIDLTPPLPGRSFTELVREHTGLDLGRYPSAELLGDAIQCRGWWAGTGGPLDRFRRTWLEWLMEHRVIPTLKQPTFVVDFPEEMGLSYRERPDRPGICWRGELILPGGFELIHVYEPLTEIEALRARYEERLQYRIAAGLPPVPLDEGLFGSVALGMPSMAGMAIGLDRLLLLVLGKGVVGDGLLFPREGFPPKVE